MSKLSLGAARAPKSIGVLKDPENDWALNQTLEFMSEKAAEIGECLYVARRIDESNAETWINEWASLAERVEKLGDESLKGEHEVSALESYLRACNYWRTAEYACVPTHPRFTETWQRSVNAFSKAIPLLSSNMEIVQVPFEDKLLPGYFLRPDNSEAKRPTMFAVGGNDSSLEQIVIGIGFPAVRRGYNFFTFEYPGHRGAVHRYPNCVKSADYSAPFRAAFDLLEKLPGVDDRIALSGYSYGGYVASQVAITESRVKALIPDSPLIDMPGLHKSSQISQIFKAVPDKLLDKIVERKLRNTVMLKGLSYYTIWTWGCPNFAEWRNWDAKMKSDIASEVHKITCPVLALVSKHEGDIMLQQAESFIEKVGSEDKRLHVFTLERDGSYDHCQLDNLSRGQQVMYDWLDDVFDYRRTL